MNVTQVAHSILHRNPDYPPDCLAIIDDITILKHQSPQGIAYAIDQMRFRLTDLLKETIKIDNDEQITILLNNPEIFQKCPERIKIIILRIRFLHHLAATILHS